MKHLGVVLLVAMVAVAGVACGDDKSSQEQAAEQLDEALAAHAEGRIDEAAAGYREVLKKDPGNKWAYYNLGLIDQQAGRNVEAEEKYRKALQADPNFPAVLFNLAILRTEADPIEAERLYRRVLDIQPNDASAHLNLGFLLIANGDRKEGRAELRTAVSLDPALASRIPKGQADEAAEPQPPGTTPTTVAP